MTNFLLVRHHWSPVLQYRFIQTTRRGQQQGNIKASVNLRNTGLLKLGESIADRWIP